MAQLSQPNSRVTKAIEALRRVLAEIGWEPVAESPTAAFHVDFGPPHMPVSSALAAIAVDTEQFIFYVNVGVFVDADRRDEVALFITRANWNLLVGEFELDFRDGHVRAKSAIDFDGSELDEGLIRNAILGVMNTVDTYVEALLDVALRGRTAEEAMAEVNI